MPTDSRRVINASIALLAISLIGVTGSMAWNARQQLAAAKSVARINAMADKLIHVASLAAVERGMTAAALGAADRFVNGETRQKIESRRREVDVAWNDATVLAREIAPKLPPSAGFSTTLDHAIQSHQVLEQARRRVDGNLGNDTRAINAEEWIAISRHFIEDTARMREAAYSSSNLPQEVSQSNIVIKHSAWLMSEYAGLERGILGFHIANRLPVPAATLDELKSYRGVVQHAGSTLADMAHLPELRPRIRQAITEMEQLFFVRFDKTRMAVYAAAATGRYSLSADKWIETATISIDAILAVATASSRDVEEKMRQTVERNRGLLTLYALLLAVVSTLALTAFVRVRKTADTLFHERELAEVTLHSIGDAVITTDARGIVDYLNPIAETLTGWGINEAKGRPLTEVFCIINGLTREPQVNPAEKCLRENRIVGLENNTVLISRDGQERVIEDSAAPVRDREGKLVGAVLVFYDVTLMRQSPHLLSHHATHDALTGLINRREFERRLTALVESAKAEDKRHVLLYLDLDQFKVVNDTCGHIAGDKLLRQLSFLLMNRIRGSDTIARLGGDEFGVLLDNCPVEPALRIANDLVRLVKEFRFVWQGTTFEISASIGAVAIAPESESPVALLSQADAACYAAKDKGRDRIQVYQPDDAEMLQRKGEMQWVPRIRRALEEDRFVLYCHKILPLAPQTDGGDYCETLLRMVDEEGGIIPPMAFIPAAERYNLMPAIDRWVIRHALAIFGKHRREVAGYTPKCFINLAAASLSDDTMFEFIREQIESSGLPANEICFEITETDAVANLDIAVTFMEKIRELGCRFALDDFGSGMSSFAYLKNLPVDYLKIDGTFVQNMAVNPTDCAMVDAINRVGHVMGIKTIAEFVKDDAILDRLRELGVDFAQGFGIAKPEPMTAHLPGGSGGCCVNNATRPPPGAG